MQETKNESKTMLAIAILMVLWMFVFLSTIIWFPEPDWRNIVTYNWLYRLQASAATVIPYYLFLRGVWVAIQCIIKNRVTPSLATRFIVAGIFWILCEVLLLVYITGYINIRPVRYHNVVLGLFLVCFVLFHVMALILERILRKRGEEAIPFYLVIIYIPVLFLLLMFALLP